MSLDSSTREAAIDLLSVYASALDERRFDDWLGLFADDALYTMLLARDEEADTNLLAIGEDKPRLAGRIEVGRTVERQRVTHLVSSVLPHAGSADVTHLHASFALIRENAVLCAGRYRFELVGAARALRIRRCRVILDHEVIHGTIYLPV